MKKSIIICVLIVVIIVAGIVGFILYNNSKTTTNNNEGKNNATQTVENVDNKPSTATINSESITLILKSEVTKKEYKVKFDSNSEDNKMYFDTQYPTTAQVRNENGNYMIDIQLNEITQAEYDITIAEEKKHSSFKEEKIGLYDGYTYFDENTETFTAKALLDNSNLDARVYATMIVSLEDDSNANGLTAETLYKSSKVQFIIDSITCTIDGKSTPANSATNTNTLNVMTDKDYYEKALEFVKQDLIKTEDHINTKEGYHKFAVYEGFGVEEVNGATYAYMHIGNMSYYLENGTMVEGSGSSVAYKVKFVNGEPVSYEFPTDGGGQEADYKRIFPENVANKIFGYNFDYSKLEEQAKEYYKK